MQCLQVLLAAARRGALPQVLNVVEVDERITKKTFRFSAADPFGSQAAIAHGEVTTHNATAGAPGAAFALAFAFAFGEAEESEEAAAAPGFALWE